MTKFQYNRKMAWAVFWMKAWSAKDVVEHVKRNGEPKEGAIIWRMP